MEIRTEGQLWLVKSRMSHEYVIARDVDEALAIYRQSAKASLDAAEVPADEMADEIAVRSVERVAPEVVMASPRGLV